MKITHEDGYTAAARPLCDAPDIVSVAEAVRYRRPHIPNAVRERSVVVIQVPNIDRTDYEKENNEHSHVTSPLLRVRGKFVVALPRGAFLWTTPLDENERVQPIHWPVTAMLPIAYKDLTNGFRLSAPGHCWPASFCHGVLSTSQVVRSPLRMLPGSNDR